MSMILGINAKQMEWNLNLLTLRLFLQHRNKINKLLTITFIFRTKEYDIFLPNLKFVSDKGYVQTIFGILKLVGWGSGKLKWKRRGTDRSRWVMSSRQANLQPYLPDSLNAFLASKQGKWNAHFRFSLSLWMWAQGWIKTFSNGIIIFIPPFDICVSDNSKRPQIRILSLWVGDVHITPKAMKRDYNHGWKFWMILLLVLTR
jgi:hypothetical protein